MARCPESRSAAAAAWYGSFARLRLEQGLQRIDVMPAGEVGEAFLRTGPMDQISLEHPLDRLRRVIGFDLAVDFAAALRLRAKATADMDVIGLGRILLVGALSLGAEE